MQTMLPAHIFPIKRNAATLLMLLSAMFVLPAYGEDDTSGDSSETTSATTTSPVIVIGGSVYGGGNEGDTGGNTNVTVYGGDIDSIFGGARMADVGGHAFVHLDGKHSTAPYTIINYVFGGNDISGSIKGTGNESVPVALTKAGDYNVNEAWNAFVRVSAKTDADGKVTADNEKIYVGQLFGGGNGDYIYDNDNGSYQVKYKNGNLIAESEDEFLKPELDRTYLEIVGGSMVYAFGGGNMATVKKDVVICVDNPSEVVNSIIDANNPNADATTGELLTTERTTTDMSLNAVTTYATSDAFQIGSFFGGNNKATMAIQPVWHLLSGKVRNIYSGGNEGDMTYPKGLLLEIAQESTIKTDNIYGGCRKANVRPLDENGDDVAAENISISGDDYLFPAGHSARVLVLGGDHNNVYGGNDITGTVYGGTAVDIRTSIRGNVYGGGNGSYAYTDNANWKDDVTYGDFYYNPGDNSADALYDFRPNVEQVWLRLVGSTEEERTIIGGSVYAGGNSATVIMRDDEAQKVQLQIGSYVTADHVFLGNNGENMIKYNEKDDANFIREGVLRTMKSTDNGNYNSIALTTTDGFKNYMKGCAMAISASVTFDEFYEPYSTTFGSFFLGGNVGSMLFDGTQTVNIDKKVNIFEKVVGGCNEANVAETDYNAAYTGGFMNITSTSGDAIQDKLVLNLQDLKITPKRWVVKRNDDYEKVLDDDGNPIYLAADGTTELDFSDVAHRTLEWDTYDVTTGKEVQAPTALPADGVSTADDKNRRLQGGNIYGGCYNSGVMDGNVVINVNGTILERNNVFDIVEEDEEGENILYANDTYHITTRNSGVILDEQGMDVLGRAMNIFGGGYGENTEIWGSATINLNKGYAFQVFGGAEKGVIGKKGMTAYDARYSTYVNLNGSVPGVSRHSDSDSDDMAETEFIYGGGFVGPIYGDAKVYLGNGRIFNSFAGSCNADIYGHTETYVGLNANGEAGFPFIRDHIYGGNDLGGEIKDSVDFADRVRQDVTDIRDSIYDKDNSTVAHSYIEYQQGRVDYIFGGCYGTYDYKDPLYNEYFDANGWAREGYTKPRLGNAFVNFRPVTNPLNPDLNTAKRVYGAGQGILNEGGIDSMQVRSYVLIDIPQTMTDFAKLEVFGAGSACGLGMGVSYETSKEAPDAYSAVIDLFRGSISGVYGGSYQAGVTRRTVVNVPGQSTIQTGSIFGGSYGVDSNHYPCDVYEANVNYRGEEALVRYIYGGNNQYRRTLYGKVNVYCPVYSNAEHTYQGVVYGAGYGQNSWSQYTEVNLYDGATVYEAYGGGYGGRVLNTESVAKWNSSLADEDKMILSLGSDFEDRGLLETNIVTESGTGATMEQTTDDDSGKHSYKSMEGYYNTNVRIHRGATVNNYCYGGGYGSSAEFDTNNTDTYREVPFAGDVCGTTYIELRGGFVNKDIYGGGTMGAVLDYYNLKADDATKDFAASANVYIEGGQVRNVYGGGWKGCVGKHAVPLSGTYSDSSDIDGETHVVIGKLGSTTDAIDAMSAEAREELYYEGAPTVLRNAYGGGEAGPVYGYANLTLNNGYIGYRYENDTYNEEINDRTAVDGIGEDLLKDCGNIFGCGYADGSDTDNASVWLYGGKIRNSLYGGGEIGIAGRGTNSNPDDDQAETLKAGSTHVYMMGGHVVQDVFGGGRGYDSQNNTGSRNTPGYVFGTTDVNIHLGTIGTPEGVEKGYGNVFGGGNIGYVYSTIGTRSGTRGDGSGEGRYYKDGKLTEDVSVKVDVWGKATANNVNVDGTNFNTGEFITSAGLNKLTYNDSQWTNIDQSGITIYNAVFAGGNVSAGSDKVMAFANTVFGNATASVVDTYSRDLISIGGDGVGGLYGDGNLTFVSGYRELNISNYGTDWYTLSSSDDFSQLTPRQQSIFTTQYKCTTANGKYSVGDIIMPDVYNKLAAADQSNWEAIHTIVNEGRFINTIQRCDFCGIKGSRLVLRGAIDRAQDESEADYTNYTINRVGELSLNQNNALGQEHGSYFGIYNVVKYLGALTSDVKFSDTRQTKSTDSNDEADGSTSYYNWKQPRLTQQNRNNGTSPNKVALASGVFLEIVKGLQSNGDKDYGPITGVVELDLINVATGEGGGFVYAKNIHGAPTYAPKEHPTLSAANKGLATASDYDYADVTATDAMETSGNFIHSLKRIVDDCFPQVDAFYGDDASPAHYWYIRGDFYVYEQLISAYTGTADTYNKEISIPLNMAIQGNARLRLLNIIPGLYADPASLSYDSDNAKSDSISIINNAVIKSFGQGDPISYWDWAMANSNDQELFTVDGGYYCNYQITVGSTTYYPGQVISTSTYTSMGDAGVDSDGNTITKASAFKVLNEVSTDNGYLLTVDFSNPAKWDDYYTLLTNSGSKLTKQAWDKLTDSDKANYVKSATFTCSADGVYGQFQLSADTIVSHKVYEMQELVTGHVSDDTQATLEPAYMATVNCEVTIGGEIKSLAKGTPISKSVYDALANDDDKAKFAVAYVCVNTVNITESDFRVLSELVTKSEWDTWSSEIKSNFQPAYYCTSDGLWGGKYFENGKNYQGIDYCQLQPDERVNFTFNKDALDALLYTNYVAPYAYNSDNDFETYIDAVGTTGHNPAISVFDNAANVIYGVSTPVDYKATYNGTGSFTYTDGSESIVVSTNTVLTNVEYENLPNDCRYYARFAVSDEHRQDDGSYIVYIVKNTFDVAGTMYNAGKAITETEYDNLAANHQANVDILTFDSAPSDGKYYYCIEEYKVGENDHYVSGVETETNTITDIKDVQYAAGNTVPVGTILNSGQYTSIPNYQLNFDISGEAPIEEATLYVPVTADIEALQKDRYVTAIYEYSYTESDNQGLDYETRVEKHIINIRIKFLSDNPVIGKIEEPDLILPLERLNFEVPTVAQGAFPILNGGWEIYPSSDDAEKHRNGQTFHNNQDPFYYYQDTYHVAYYAETRMGKAYSNHVPVHVANYQRLADVINNPYHMHINHRDNIRDPKIYIDSRSVDTYGSTINDGTTTYANELDAMKGVWNIVNSDYGTEHSEVVNGKSRVITGAQNLDFILQGDVTTANESWTPIGDDTQCFGGRFHGNGHYISGLDNSLFGKLCGEVYNLGVMGTFTKGGVANTGSGRIENAWVWSTGEPNGQAVYANPDDDAVIINCYYPETNAFTESANAQIMKRPVADFVNGSVAYDLNRFYLEARYRLNSSKTDTHSDDVLFRLPDGTLAKDTSTKIADVNGIEPGGTGYIDTYANQRYAIQYPASEAFREYNDKNLGYVERYYADGDFRFAEGLKPKMPDMRFYAGDTDEYLPLYPDDYIFFGQKLTYGLYDSSHDQHPMAVAKSHTTGNSEWADNSKNGLLINDPDDQTENRVYRAPAYFQNDSYGSSVMFNAHAAFADSYAYTVDGEDYTSKPHHRMTAIDFTGGNGDTHGYQGVVAGVASDFTADYKPLLDFERLDAIQTQGLTQNLLAYTPQKDAEGTKNTQTYNVLTTYFDDKAYEETDEDYRTVAVENTAGIKGHVVLQASTTTTGGGDYTYQPQDDHLLVDRQDFFAPMAYTFDGSHRMWYQRKPDHYAEGAAGWEGVSLPFAAELVTTQDKGELTHFYEGSTYGHEYWLRQYEGIKSTDTDTGIATAKMNYPDAGSNEKEYTNTFLYVYYYSQDEFDDLNEDKYQKYYNEAHTYGDYPYSEAGRPYITGFPGKRYYEFDLSGVWTPQHRVSNEVIDSPGAQVITFASAAGGTIQKSSVDMTKASDADNYVFTPNYLNGEVAAGSYVLNAEGSSYVKTEAATAAVPFRPYFVATSGSRQTRLVFGNADTSVGDPGDDRMKVDAADMLIVGARRGQIVVESQLKQPTQVRIVTASGIQMALFTIEPGQVVTTPIHYTGVYLVGQVDGRTKKLRVEGR